MYAQNTEDGILVTLEQHEETEEEWVETPVPQWLYKSWNVLDEQAHDDDVIVCIANSISCDFVCFSGGFNGEGDFWFVALIDGEPHMFNLNHEWVEFLNVTGERLLKWQSDEIFGEDAKEELDRYMRVKGN